MGMSVNLATELNGASGSGGGLSSDGRPSATLTINLTANADSSEEPGGCTGTPQAPKWYDDGAWDASEITILPPDD